MDLNLDNVNEVKFNSNTNDNNLNMNSFNDSQWKELILKLN